LSKLTPSIEPTDDEQVIDATINYCCHRFVDPHVHLDATQTAVILNGINQARCLTEFAFGVNVKKN